MSNRYLVLPNRCFLRLSGADTRSFLQGLVTQDVERVSAARSAWSAILTPQGKYLCDFFVLDAGDGTLLLDCEATQATALQRMLNMYKLRAEVTVELLEPQWHALAVIGDISPLSLLEQCGRTERFHEGRIIAYTDPRHPAMGARVAAPAGEGETWLLERGYAQACEYDYTLKRIMLGIPEAGQDSIAQKTLILENGFDVLNGVSFDKGCYVGQEVTARTKYRANLHKRLYRVEGSAPLPATGSDITLDGRNVGEMRSSLEHNGLALLRNDAVKKAQESGASLLAGDVELAAHALFWHAEQDGDG